MGSDISILYRITRLYRGRPVKGKRRYAPEKEQPPNLHQLCELGDLCGVKQTVISPDDLEVLDCHGYTPLDWACVGGHIGLLNYIHDEGFNITQQVENQISGILHKACANGREEIVYYLLNRQFPPHRHDALGRTPLVHAVLNGQWRIARTLMRRTRMDVAVCGGWAGEMLNETITQRKLGLTFIILQCCAGVTSDVRKRVYHAAFTVFTAPTDPHAEFMLLFWAGLAEPAAAAHPYLSSALTLTPLITRARVRTPHQILTFYLPDPTWLRNCQAVHRNSILPEARETLKTLQESVPALHALARSVVRRTLASGGRTVIAAARHLLALQLPKRFIRDILAYEVGCAMFPSLRKQIDELTDCGDTGEPTDGHETITQIPRQQ